MKQSSNIFREEEKKIPYVETMQRIYFSER